MFEGRRWIRNLRRYDKERSTVLTHRDLDAKAGVKFEWLISQDYGKNEVKLSDRQMREIFDYVRLWNDESYNMLINERPEGST